MLRKKDKKQGGVGTGVSGGQWTEKTNTAPGATAQLVTGAASQTISTSLDRDGLTTSGPRPAPPQTTCSVCSGLGSDGTSPTRTGEMCLGCGGSGTRADTGKSRGCSDCEGDGTLSVWRKNGAETIPCWTCGGAGEVPQTASGQDEVFVPGHGKFGRIVDPGAPDDALWPGRSARHLRIEADRDLTDQEVAQIAEVFKHRLDTRDLVYVGDRPTRDSQRSFVVQVDSDGDGTDLEYLDAMVFDALRGTQEDAASQNPADSLQLSLYADSYSELRGAEDKVEDIRNEIQLSR